MIGALLEHRFGKRLAVALVLFGTGWKLAQGELNPPEPGLNRPEHLNALGEDLGADAVAWKQCDAEYLHASIPSPPPSRPSFSATHNSRYLHPPRQRGDASTGRDHYKKNPVGRKSATGMSEVRPIIEGE